MTLDKRRKNDNIGKFMKELERIYGKEKYGDIRKELKEAWKKSVATSDNKDFKQEKIPEFIEIADEFVNGYYKGYYTITEEAYNYKVSMDKQENSLGNFLTISISNYLISKADYTSRARNYHDASILLTLLTQAYGLKMIRDNELFIHLEQSVQEVKSLKEQNKILTNEKNSLYKELEKANKSIEECNKVLNNLLPKGDKDNEL